jgi:DNA-binding transcriptional regulator YiaG
MPFQDQDEDTCFPIPRSLKKRQAKELEKKSKEELKIYWAKDLRETSLMTQKGIARRLNVPLSKVRKWT